ncbi:FAD-dependent oxidoreductase [Streptomyces sp. NPDC058470]|uniref:FAD-dependent oxidoreductase n=1 Tax=Streptomyces sp. NPDC058470 TaxID=3346515 RepID=UPI00365DD36C
MVVRPIAVVTDLAVVGAGVLGLTAALWARHRHPAWTVLVLDRQQVLHGASGHSLAIAAPSGHTPRVRELALRSGQLYRSGVFREAVRDRAGLVVCRAATARALSHHLTAPVRRLPAIEPYEAGLLGELRTDAGDEVYAVGRGFLHVEVAALAAWVDIVPDWPVVSCIRTRSCWELRGPGGAVHRARRVVVAVGPWAAPEVGDRSGAAWGAGGGRVKRVAVLRVPAARATASDPLVVFPEENLLLAPADGYVEVSFLRTRWRDVPLSGDGQPGADPADQGLTDEDLAEGRSALAARGPSLAARATVGRAFWDTYYPDAEPRVTSPPGDRSLVRLDGGAGTGVRLAPALAEAAIGAVE